MTTPCTHDPPCSTLRLYHWGTTYIAARDLIEAEAVGDDYGLIEQNEEFDPRECPPEETTNVLVDDDGCQCNEYDAADEIELTSTEWICRQREGNETGFIVGNEI